MGLWSVMMCVMMSWVHYYRAVFWASTFSSPVA